MTQGAYVVHKAVGGSDWVGMRQLGKAPSLKPLLCLTLGFLGSADVFDVLLECHAASHSSDHLVNIVCRCLLKDGFNTASVIGPW